MLVTLVWTVLPLLAAVPLMLQLPSITFTDAYFETMSGLTATGSTALSGLDQLPLSINVWRHLIVWIGGMGILVLAVAILPVLGVGGSQAFKAEVTGPLKETKLTPRIADTAKALYAIYFALSLACFIAYRVAGMSWSDAFMHMCSTIGLGGFSSHDDSFAYWNSPAIETVAVVFMTLSGFSYLLHFTAWRQRSPIALLAQSGGTRVFVYVGCVRFGDHGFPAAAQCLYRLADRAPLCAVQHRVGGHHDRVLKHEFRPVAHFCAGDDAVRIGVRNLRRIDRRWHQDDSRG